MVTENNKDHFAENEWLRQFYKDSCGKTRRPASRKLWITKKKRALRAFLKRAYLFILTSTLM